MEPKKKTAKKAAQAPGQPVVEEEVAAGVRDPDQTGKGHPDPDRPWRVAQLAATLIGRRALDRSGQGEVPGIADELFDRDLSRAILRAERLLSQAEEHEYQVHAYQVFEEGDVLSEADIFEQFKGAGWDGLSSKAPVTDLMKQLHAWITDLRDKASERSVLTDNATKALAHKHLVRALKALQEDSAVQATYRGFDDATQSFLDSLTDSAAPGGTTQTELVEDSVWLTGFAAWCFPTKGRGKQKVHRYRPHEIFLFAAMNNWKAPGESRKLVRHRTELKVKFVPGPPRETTLGLYRYAFRKFADSNPTLGALDSLIDANPSGESPGSAPADDGETGAS